MIRFFYTTIALLIGLSGIIINSSFAADGERDCAKDREWCRKQGKECRPEQQRRCGKRKGDWYGARRAVHSAEEARGLFVAYFAGQDVTISAINEKPWRFEADVKDHSGNLVDRVIVDKRSGRVRSIY